jgi:hypothetical protein
MQAHSVTFKADTRLVLHTADWLHFITVCRTWAVSRAHGAYEKCIQSFSRKAWKE